MDILLYVREINTWSNLENIFEFLLSVVKILICGYSKEMPKWGEIKKYK